MSGCREGSPLSRVQGGALKSLGAPPRDPAKGMIPLGFPYWVRRAWATARAETSVSA